MDSKTLIWIYIFAIALSPVLQADGPGRIYTQNEAKDAGIISGKVAGAFLSHAIAVERDRNRVYLASLDAECISFRFEKLPTGKFDLVLVTKDQRLIEGLALGSAAVMSQLQMKSLDESIAKADSFFNRHIIHRTGMTGDKVLALTERIRDDQILRGSGELINACLRRLEIIELQGAENDWQLVKNRHLLRLEIPKNGATSFLTHHYFPSLSGLRLADGHRDMGTIDLKNVQHP